MVDHRKVSREKMLFKKTQKNPEMKTEWAKNIDLAHAGLEPATFALLARRSNQLS